MPPALPETPAPADAASPAASRPHRSAPLHDALPCPRCAALTAISGGECSSCDEPLFTAACVGCGETLFAGHGFCVGCGAGQPGVADPGPWAEGTPTAPRRAAALAHVVNAPRRRIPLRRSRGYCPRCRTPLVQRAVGTVDLDECRGCGGIFVEAIELTRLVFDRVTAAALAASLRDRPPALPPNQLRGSCPTCAQALRPRDLPRLGARGLVCRAHGLWIEHRELLTAARCIADGALHQRSAIETVVCADDLRHGRFDALLAHARSKPHPMEPMGPIEVLAAVFA